MRNTQELIAEVCDEIKAILLEKNRKYGDAALNPRQVFSRSDVLEGIRIRMDDKINRIANQQVDEDEDVIGDLLGYLVLYEVAKRLHEPSESDKIVEKLKEQGFDVKKVDFDSYTWGYGGGYSPKLGWQYQTNASSAKPEDQYEI